MTTGGTVTTTPEALSDGFAVLVDDGSGALRVVVGAATGISREALRRGSTVGLTGVLGQHASSGTDGGYRLYLRSRVRRRGRGLVTESGPLGLWSWPQRLG